MENFIEQHQFFPIPIFTDNYVWSIINQKNGYVTLVDPGAAIPVINFLEDNDYKLEAILITHHHADHIGGVLELVQKYNPLIYAPQGLNFSSLTHEVNDQSPVNLTKTDINFQVMAVPGHTLDEVAYYAPGYLFCGDTLFSAGCGRIFEGTPEQMLNSLQKINQLPGDTLVFCAHEYTLANLAFAKAVDPDNEAITQHIKHIKNLRAQHKPSLPSQLELEQQINPFLRVSTEAVKISAEKYTGRHLDKDVDIFAAIREWKNRF